MEKHYGKHGKGVIDYEDFCCFVIKIHPWGESTDRNDELDAQNARSMTPCSDSLPVQERIHVGAWFTEFDLNSDDIIDLQELGVALRSNGWEGSQMELEDLMEH